MPGHISGNATWTNTASTPVTATTLENFEAVADNTHPFAGLRTQKLYMAQAQGATINFNSEYTMIDIAGPGVIRSIWMALPSATNPNPAVDGRLRCYYDGSGTPAWDIDLGSLFVTHYGAGSSYGPHHTPHLSAQILSNAFGVGVMMTYPMPFGNRIKLTFLNPGTTTGGFYHMTTYNLSSTDRANGLRFRMATARIDGQAYIADGADADIANITSGPGWIVGLSLIGGMGATNLTWLERDFQFQVDGESLPPRGSGTQIVATGTEDWFDSAWYYNGWNDFQSSFHSYIGTDARASTPYIVGQTTDLWSKWGGIPFNSSCVVKWLDDPANSTNTYFTYALMYYSP